ncbi:MAG: hypothetical protein ACFBSF_09285 [Leptolyngbyaceae cyanobacterium]
MPALIQLRCQGKVQTQSKKRDWLSHQHCQSRTDRIR